VAVVLLTSEDYASSRKNKSRIDKKLMEEFVQMVVYKSGFIRLLNIKNLSQKARFNLPGLEPDEEVTCGSLSPHN